MVIRFSTAMSLDDGSDARGTLTDRNPRQMHEMDDESCISSEVLEAIAHVDEMVGDLRAEGYSCDSTIEKLVWAASACREAADSMDELRSELRSQQAKRRRVALEDHDAAEDNDGSSDDDASDDDDEPGESAEDADSAADDESADDEAADDNSSGGDDCPELDYLEWPLPPDHPGNGTTTSLRLKAGEYVLQNAHVYEVKGGYLCCLGDDRAAQEWSKMKEPDATAFRDFFPLSYRNYPSTLACMGIAD